MTIRLDPPNIARDPARVPRRSLLDLLEQANNAGVIWIQAPAGSGKTTLLAQWATETSIPVAWLALDTAANRPDRFGAMIDAATRRLSPSSWRAEPTLVRDTGDLLELIDGATLCIGQSATPCALVFDELERIDNPAILTAIAALIEQRPSNLRILLASRTRGELPLARWRIQQPFIEIDASQLALALDEIDATLASALEPAVAAEFRNPVLRITTGWAAGVGLSRRYLLRTAAAGHTPAESEMESVIRHHATEFFIDDVLSRQSPELVDFLLKTSILDGMTVAACAEIFGFPWSRKWLQDIEDAGLFLNRIDSNPPVWRYLDLFGIALRRAFEERQGADVVEAAHRAASDWYARTSQLERALHHALRAHDVDRAHRLVVAAAPLLTQSGEIGTLASVLGTIQPSPALDAGELLYWRNYVLLKTGDYETLTTELPLLEAIWGGSTDPVIVTRLTSLRATQQMYAGASDVSLTSVDRALTSGAGLSVAERSLAQVAKLSALVLSGDIAGADRILRGNPAIDPSGALVLRVYAADIALAQCETLTAATILRQALDHYSTHISHAYLICFLTLIEITRGWGDLAESSALMAQAEAYERTIPHRLLRWQVDHSLSRLAAAEGDWATAHLHASAMVRALPLRCAPDKRRYAATWFAWVAAQQDDSGPMHAVLETETSSVYRSLWDVQAGLFRAALLSTVGDDDMAIRLLGSLRTRAAADGRSYDILQSSVLEAVIHEHTNNREAALISLQRAIPLARRTGFRQLFLRHGATMRDLLRALPHHQGARHILGWLDEAGPPRVDVLTSAPTTAEAVALTPREAEILQLVELGLSNDEIGAALGISVPTVKRHLTNLFAKLGVRNRTEAIYQFHHRSLSS